MSFFTIAGESGSGKSTIAKLLTGQIEPQGGTVRIGGIDIYTVNSESVSGKVSMVVQEPVLFNMTIRENLLLAKADATEAELLECCRRASIYDFIETLQNKLDTVIGEKGVKLSGGQKQRLSIARAFLQDRDIIIFDESTSALDSEKENDIITAVKSLSAGKTMISIAHRLSTILSCDKVMVLKDGAIAAMDTHENLRNRDETYDLLFQNQYTYSDSQSFADGRGHQPRPDRLYQLEDGAGQCMLHRIDCIDKRCISEAYTGIQQQDPEFHRNSYKAVSRHNPRNNCNKDVQPPQMGFSPV